MDDPVGGRTTPAPNSSAGTVVPVIRPIIPVRKARMTGPPSMNLPGERRTGL
ncbi:hypothetical protein [Nonomuraea sp. NPDC049480]|uniref:hypothetical protein n=1 Tax=Nonomuraea sp. NPDC049480 TaxID=3364353 RepID=UPI003789668C